MTEVVILKTGTANLASVAAAFERVGCTPRLSEDITDAREAARMVLPGVGSFGPVAHRLEKAGLAQPIADRVRSGRPTLAICLGLQLLAEASDEAPDVRGLGVLPVHVSRLPHGVRVPQLGWNRVSAEPGCRLLRDGAAYFANSYALAGSPAGWASATTDHGGRFVSAVEKGAVLACQFHPELSGSWGHELIKRWLDAAEEVL
jgi:imidazole glycerol phosphate synthase glutamine amidotransferase subunit